MILQNLLVYFFFYMTKLAACIHSSKVVEAGWEMNATSIYSQPHNMRCISEVSREGAILVSTKNASGFQIS